MNTSQITRLSSKGQIVIPSNVRENLGISIGTKFMILTDGSNLLLKPMKPIDLQEFKSLISESAKIAKQSGIDKSDLPKLLKKVRNENRS